jgi:hypothetical protein
MGIFNKPAFLMSCILTGYKLIMYSLHHLLLEQSINENQDVFSKEVVYARLGTMMGWTSASAAFER